MDGKWAATILFIFIAMWILYDQYQQSTTEHFKIKIKIKNPFKKLAGLFKKVAFRKKTLRIPVTNQGLFQHKGCTMLTLEEFAAGRLVTGPFLTIPMSAPTFPAVVQQAKKYIQIVAAGETDRLLASIQKGLAPAAPPPSALSSFLSPIIGSSTTQRTTGSGLYPYDYPTDRRERETNLKSAVETFVNLPQATKGRAQPFEFYGPVYLLTANHPNVVPPLQDRGVAPPPPDPVIPPKDADAEEEENPTKSELDDQKAPIEVPTLEINNGKPYVYAVLYFPSLTKEGRPIPNYEYLGRCHQWMYRLLEARQYKSFHKQCQQTCMGTPTRKEKGKWKMFTQYYYEYYTPCGIHRNVPDPLPEQRSSKYEYFFGVYELDLTHPDIASLVSANSPQRLQRSILPMGTTWTTHCMNILVSDNQQYFLALRPNTYGIYENVRGEDLSDLCRRGRIPKFAKLKSGVTFAGYNATRLEVSDDHLFIYGNRVIRYRKRGKWRYALSSEEEILREMRLSTQGAERPLALVLHDNGTIAVYDRFNRKVTSDQLLDQMYAPIEEDKEPQLAYDKNADYRYRIEQLKAYLRILGILKDGGITSGVLLDGANEDDLLGIFATSEEEAALLKSGVFDQKVDYIERLRQLVQYLTDLGIAIPASLIPSEEVQEILYESPEFIPAEAQTKDKLDAYNQQQEVMNRILQMAQELGVDPSIYFQTDRPSVTSSLSTPTPPVDPEAYEASQNPY